MDLVVDDLHEEIVSTEEIFSGKLLTVKREEVLLPDGTRSRREVVYHPGAVTMVPLTERGTVILVRQFRLPAGKALLEIPAGVLQANESPADCAKRELAEEINMEAGNLEQLTSFYLAPGYSSELIHLFLARDLRPTSGRPDFDERLEKVELPFGEALALIDKKEIQDGKTIAGLLLAQRHCALENN
jgi:ADP-ribose pyrophosphatase